MEEDLITPEDLEDTDANDPAEVETAERAEDPNKVVVPKLTFTKEDANTVELGLEMSKWLKSFLREFTLLL